MLSRDAPFKSIPPSLMQEISSISPKLLFSFYARRFTATRKAFFSLRP